MKTTREQIAELDVREAELDAQREALQKRLIEEMPVSVGDVVKILGYSYTGKYMRVERMFIRRYRGRNEYSLGITGNVLKKDMSPSKQDTTMVLAIDDTGTRYKEHIAKLEVIEREWAEY